MRKINFPRPIRLNKKLVLEGRLELPRIAPLAPQASASAIPPPEHFIFFFNRISGNITPLRPLVKLISRFFRNFFRRSIFIRLKITGRQAANGFREVQKMEAWVGIEPTRHGFANRSLSHSSTTPWFQGVIYCPFPEKQVPIIKKFFFFQLFSVFSAILRPFPARNRIDKDYI